MKAWPFALLFSALFAAAPAAAIELDLLRYMGAWHEIAHIPNFAQKGCTDTIVHYRLNDRGGFDLANTCWKFLRRIPGSSIVDRTWIPRSTSRC